MSDDAEDRRAALAAAALMASARGDIGFRDDSSRHWLALADEAYRWLKNRDNAKEKTMTEDAAAAEAAEDVTAAEGAPAEESAESAEAEAGEGAESDAAGAPDAEPAA